MLNAKKSKKIIHFLTLFIAMVTVLGVFTYANPVEAKEQPKYQIRIDLTENLVFIDEWNENARQYEATEHVFLCSPGRDATPTPTGTFTAKPRVIDWQYDENGTGEWVRFRSWESCYVNGATIITGAILFHSVPSTKPDYGYVEQRDINLMGYQGSHGCIRLWPRQSTWIRENCAGATVKIYYGAGHDDSMWALREDLKKEAPPKELWPNTLVTDKTKFIYTYFNDTLEKLAEMAEISKEDLIELNPDINLKDESISVGLAVRVK